MGLNEIENEFIKISQKGLWFPFLTAKEISKKTQTDISNTHKYIKKLLKLGAVAEHPFNGLSKEKRYHMSKEYYIKNYKGVLNIYKNETSIEKTQPDGV